jgi:hypothetical protein
LIPMALIMMIIGITYNNEYLKFFGAIILGIDVVLIVFVILFCKFGMRDIHETDELV